MAERINVLEALTTDGSRIWIWCSQIATVEAFSIQHCRVTMTNGRQHDLTDKAEAVIDALQRMHGLPWNAKVAS